MCNALSHSPSLYFFLVHSRRLVEDVLGDNSSHNTNGNNKVPMEKVVMLIWQFRDDPSVITFMARFMTKVRIYFLWLLLVGSFGLVWWALMIWV